MLHGSAVGKTVRRCDSKDIPFTSEYLIQYLSLYCITSALESSQHIFSLLFCVTVIDDKFCRSDVRFTFYCMTLMKNV